MKRSCRLTGITLPALFGCLIVVQHVRAQTPAAENATPPLQAVQQGAGAPAGQPAYAADAKFQLALDAAHEKHLHVDEHLARWKKAYKLSGNQCVECLHEVIAYQMRQAQWKDAVTSATQLEALATEPKQKFFAEAELGAALLNSNDGNPKPDQLREAESSFNAALQISPRTKSVIFSEGRALAMLGRDADAKAMFQRYLDQAGEADRYRTRAEHFVDNPHLAALPMAPPFTVTTSEGEEINLDEQVGKVVLLDFWATWCGPCKQTLPVIHNIAKKFAGQPLVVVSISSDQDDIAWKQFIASHDMFWAQYRDAGGQLSRAYGVSAIPRFFTIDSDGVLKSVKVGTEAADDLQSELKKLIKQATQADQKKALATDKPAGM